MKIDTVTLKKQVILHLPYLLFLLVFAKLGQTVRLAPGADASQKLLGLSEGFTLAFQSMWPGAALDWLVGLCGAVIMRLAVYLKGKDAKKYRKNVEYGSARWGSKTDIAPFMDQKPENNIILTQSEGLMMSGRPKNPANARNKNVLVVGGSGSGKTRFFIKPNLMQMHSSYVVTDPKGTVLIEVGKLLSRGTPKLDKDGKPVRGKNGKIVYEPYKIKVFNTINFSKSMHYNPFAYIHNEKDISNWLEHMDCRPYRTEVQLYKSLLFLKRSIDRDLIVTSQREALQTLRCIISNLEYRFYKAYGMEIEDKRTVYGECTYRLVPREDEPSVCLMHDWIYLPSA